MNDTKQSTMETLDAIIAALHDKNDHLANKFGHGDDYVVGHAAAVAQVEALQHKFYMAGRL